MNTVSESEAMYLTSYATLNVCFCRSVMAGRTVVISSHLPPPRAAGPKHHVTSSCISTPQPAPQTKAFFYTQICNYMGFFKHG